MATDVEAPVEPARPPEGRTERDATARIRRTLEGVLGIPSTEGNRIDVLRNGDEIFPAMLDAIRSAEEFVDFLTFVYWTGPIAQELAEALADRARHGVRVRVILDAVGARTMDRALVAEMEEAGAEVAFFRVPITWRVWQVEHRTHRKVLIVDEKVAFTGGVGIAEEWMGDARNPNEWRDTHFRIMGPAVDGLRGAFTTNWIETGRPIFDNDSFIDQPECGSSCLQVVRGSASIGWSDIAVMMRTLVALAEERIRITSAYFTPDATFVELLCEAADRGVEVDILVPGPHADKRIVQVASEASYERLLECGIRIWNYQPTMLHAKVVTIDGAAACVGSSNVNSRSMARDDEVSVMIYDPEVVAVLDRHFEEDLERSEQIHEVRWERRNVAQRALEVATGIIRPRL
jgi:cardiolipin synthase A/B